MHETAAGRSARGTAVLVGLAACTLVAPAWTQGQGGVAAELRELYEADQADRRLSSPPTAEQWAGIVERDRLRQARVHEILRGDLMTTAEDYYHAAMVLQHGDGSEDILLAHILATAAGFRGHERARWLSAAALDRYLHRTQQPQRLGTQYVRAHPEEPFRIDPDAPWSQGAYEPWLTDSLRQVFGVPPLAEQSARVEAMNAGSQ